MMSSFALPTLSAKEQQGSRRAERAPQAGRPHSRPGRSSSCAVGVGSGFLKMSSLSTAPENKGGPQPAGRRFPVSLPTASPHLGRLCSREAGSHGDL